MSNNKKYFYSVYGFNVVSDLVLDELNVIPVCENPNLIIQLTGFPIPKMKDQQGYLGKSYFIAKSDLFFLHLAGVANYLVTKEEGRTIIKIKVTSNDKAETAKTWLYGTCFSVALQMNNLFPLHASAVSKNGKVSLFMGISGAGKSTLASQLTQRSFISVSDDKSLLQWDETKELYRILPSLNIFRLWDDSLHEVNTGLDLKSKTQIVYGIDKYQYNFAHETEDLSMSHVDHIFLIRKLLQGKLGHVSLTKEEAKQVLHNNTHRVKFLKKINKTKAHEQFLMKLADTLPVTVLLRPKETSINEFVDYVENLLLS